MHNQVGHCAISENSTRPLMLEYYNTSTQVPGVLLGAADAALQGPGGKLHLHVQPGRVHQADGGHCDARQLPGMSKVLFAQPIDGATDSSELCSVYHREPSSIIISSRAFVEARFSPY